MYDMIQIAMRLKGAKEAAAAALRPERYHPRLGPHAGRWIR